MSRVESREDRRPEAVPRVSVVIPTHNRERLVTEAIESVLSQTFSELEIIVADDGSDDATASRVAAIEGPILLVKLPRSGIPGAVRNRALAEARGELVAFLDDDDMWLPKKLERQVALFEDPAVSFSFGDVRHLRADGSLSEPTLRTREKRSGNIFDSLVDDCFIHPSTFMARRSLLADRPFDEKLTSCEDYDLWLRISFAHLGGFLAEPLVIVRKHGVQLSLESDLTNTRNAIRALEHARSSLPLRRAERRHVRGSLARFHAQAGLELLASGNGAAATRHHLTRSLTLRPLRGSTWRAVARSLLT
jgi:glycosyltransferase involved in cell wall biosynthesis